MTASSSRCLSSIGGGLLPSGVDLSSPSHQDQDFLRASGKEARLSLIPVIKRTDGNLMLKEYSSFCMRPTFDFEFLSFNFQEPINRCWTYRIVHIFLALFPCPRNSYHHSYWLSIDHKSMYFPPCRKDMNGIVATIASILCKLI